MRGGQSYPPPSVSKVIHKPVISILTGGGRAVTRTDLLQLYLQLGLTPIPLKPQSKKPLVKWGEGWKPTSGDLMRWAAKPDTNWGVRCGLELAVLDFDSPGDFERFLEAHPEAALWPTVRTGRGFHLWVRPKRPISTKRHDGLEVKCLGSYAVAPPSVHPNGLPYSFEVAPNGVLPEVDLERLLGLGQVDSSPTPRGYESIRHAAPSDFALRYGRSLYPRSLCGKATAVLTRSDGKVKRLISLRCWKWDCPNCAPLLQRYWLEKLRVIPFRFIIRLPSVAKPTAFLRRIGKPRYVHMVDNGKSWLFLLEGEAERVWAEAQRAGYDLIHGDVASGATPEAIEECLGKALSQEGEPLNTRRKVTHSRGLLKRALQEDRCDESKKRADCGEGEDDTKTAFGSEPLAWDSEVLMKPIQQVAEELEAQGWDILWQSEVEAIAIRGETPNGRDMDILELFEMLGVKLKKVGREYMGLCPFHDDHNPSLSVNREKGVWKCHSTRCGLGGGAYQFVTEWQRRYGKK
jgi:hypothetical protein